MAKKHRKRRILRRNSWGVSFGNLNHEKPLKIEQKRKRGIPVGNGPQTLIVFERRNGQETVVKESLLKTLRT